MNYAESITPADIRDYAKFFGWTPVAEAMRDRLYVLNHPAHRLHQVVVPMDIARPDYDDAVRVAIQQLSLAQHRPFEQVQAALLETGFDTLRLAVHALRQYEDSLPLNFASRAIKGVENALRASACSTILPQAFHPRMNRVEAQKLVDTAQLRHTESGSFVLKVACPLDAISGDEDPEPGPIPFVRRTIDGMFTAVDSLVTALETDTVEQLVDQAQSPEASPLSANLCDALMAFADDKFRTNLDFSVSWSPRLPVVSPRRRSLGLRWDYFPRIEQIRTALRPAQRPEEDTFIAMVDELRGDLGRDEQREGEVILQLFLEGEPVRARAQLNVQQHALAHRAYGQGKTYLRVTALLHPGNQPRRLTNITAFDIVN